MPTPEKGGAQPPLELIRQLLEMGGVYDTERNTWKVQYMLSFLLTKYCYWTLTATLSREFRKSRYIHVSLLRPFFGSFSGNEKPLCSKTDSTNVDCPILSSVLRKTRWLCCKVSGLRQTQAEIPNEAYSLVSGVGSDTSQTVPITIHLRQRGRAPMQPSRDNLREVGEGNES